MAYIKFMTFMVLLGYFEADTNKSSKQTNKKLQRESAKKHGRIIT